MELSAWLSFGPSTRGRAVERNMEVTQMSLSPVPLQRTEKAESLLSLCLDLVTVQKAVDEVSVHRPLKDLLLCASAAVKISVLISGTQLWCKRS